MDPATRELIEALHRESPFCYALAATGGGAAAVGMLLNVPGGSRSLLEVVIPYHEGALAEYLGRVPRQHCSAETAEAMARRALARARWLAPRRPAAGVGCTASLATDRPRRGEHRFHISVATGCGRGATHSLTLAKGARDRAGEEAVLDAALLNALADVFGVTPRVPVPLLPGEAVLVSPHAASALASLLSVDGPATLCVDADGRHSTHRELPAALLPGAFNPLHDGHLRLAAEGARRLGRAVEFELSAVNADKGTLDIEEVRHRLAAFAGRAAVWVTRAPTFVEKAELFPGTVFVVGADTAERVLAPRYYGGDSGLAAALGRIRDLRCSFLVACRPLPGGACLALEDLPVPATARDLFTAIPREEFCVGVSSTELRHTRHG